MTRAYIGIDVSQCRLDVHVRPANLHRRFDNTRRRESGGTFDWMGPAVSQAKALDTAAALRDRITSHQRIMVMNDEARVWARRA